ncbi:MAG: hypothetical protein A2W91_01770 [Bacteroidetes bacterium GWF2_38_335]|nr:MAG: hypothetical protein A2W91_01770 [Bacteroidetes bacterium GWF2_38_335]OFY78796.1 MAG: hypothetical protein A2281_19345 [Bacteroidetes bacterium RIFOXYA12_FULL_38_20]HBS85192.1 hypothetical protein [Bacteroidales bacterium]
MKTIVIIFTFMMAGILNIKAQTEEESVKKIREMYSQVNSNLSNYELTVREIMGESTEGSIFEGFVSDDYLVLLRCKFYGEMGNIVEEYYFDKGTLFFVFVSNTQYSAPIYDENTQALPAVENRYYFTAEGMIRWVNSEKIKVDNTSDEFKQKAAEIYTELERLRNLYYSEPTDNPVEEGE